MSDVCKLVFRLLVELLGLAGAAIRYRMKNPRIKKKRDVKRKKDVL